jgi:hypothetical protein
MGSVIGVFVGIVGEHDPGAVAQYLSPYFFGREAARDSRSDS